MAWYNSASLICKGKKDEEYRHQLGSFGISGDLVLRPIAEEPSGNCTDSHAHVHELLCACPQYVCEV